MKNINVISLEVLGFQLTLRLHLNGSRWGFRNLAYPGDWKYPGVSLDLGYLSIVFERYWLD